MKQDTPHRPVIGLLGGIGCGKSTVAAAFARLGCATIDADQIAHAQLKKEPIKREILDRLGPALLGPEGELERRKIAEVVFSDPEKLGVLNGILHPHVLAECESLLEEYARSSSVTGIILDMPLLLEVGWDAKCDHLLFIACDPEVRLKRLLARGPISREALELRENFQISLDSKRRRADNAIHNNSDLAALTEQITEVFSKFLNR